MLRLQAQRILIENGFHIKSVFIAGANYERKKKKNSRRSSGNVKKKNLILWIKKKAKRRMIFSFLLAYSCVVRVAVTSRARWPSRFAVPNKAKSAHLTITWGAKRRITGVAPFARVFFSLFFFLIIDFILLTSIDNDDTSRWNIYREVLFWGAGDRRLGSRVRVNS